MYFECSPIVLLMEQITNEGVIEDDEAKILQVIFQLNDLITTDLMTSRVVLICLSENAALVAYQKKIIKYEQ